MIENNKTYNLNYTWRPDIDEGYEYYEFTAFSAMVEGTLFGFVTYYR